MKKSTLFKLGVGTAIAVQIPGIIEGFKEIQQYRKADKTFRDNLAWAAEVEITYPDFLQETGMENSRESFAFFMHIVGQDIKPQPSIDLLTHYYDIDPKEHFAELEEELED